MGKRLKWQSQVRMRQQSSSVGRTADSRSRGGGVETCTGHQVFGVGSHLTSLRRRALCRLYRQRPHHSTSGDSLGLIQLEAKKRCMPKRFFSPFLSVFLSLSLPLPSSSKSLWLNSQQYFSEVFCDVSK